MTDFREKFWVSGKLIAFICFFESSLKFALSITDLVFGHFRNAVPSETRIFIHSIIYVVIGSLGILCSILLLIGLTKKETGKILCWICLAGISICHQFFFSFEVILILLHFEVHSSVIMFVGIVLIAWIVMEAYFMKFIILLCQEILEREIPRAPLSTWRVPTISELLADASVMGESPPPVYSLKEDDRGVSEA